MSEDAADSIRRHTLILESSHGLETMDLARRLRELGAPATVVRDFEDAEAVLREEDLDVGAVLVPTHCEPEDLRRRLDLLRGLAPKDGLRLISVGDTPEKAHRKRLRKAGVKLAMWNPLHEANLRFQLHRAHSPAPDGFGKRESPRVPTDWHCSVTVTGRTKNATIFSLAETGAFLATKRAVMNGAKVSLQMALPDGTMDTEADVVYANVPGNLQRPSLPLGMGVQFCALDKKARKRLRSQIKECVGLLEV